MIRIQIGTQSMFSVHIQHFSIQNWNLNFNATVAVVCDLFEYVVDTAVWRRFDFYSSSEQNINGEGEREKMKRKYSVKYYKFLFSQATPKFSFILICNLDFSALCRIQSEKKLRR